MYIRMYDKAIHQRTLCVVNHLLHCMCTVHCIFKATFNENAADPIITCILIVVFEKISYYFIHVLIQNASQVTYDGLSGQPGYSGVDTVQLPPVRPKIQVCVCVCVCVLTYVCIIHCLLI